MLPPLSRPNVSTTDGVTFQTIRNARSSLKRLARYKMAVKSCMLLVFGLAIRCFLVFSGLPDLLKDSVEVSTPLNSWKRVVEGVYLHEKGIDPYSGNIYHETPAGLIIFKYFLDTLGPWLPLIFIACDLLTALCLGQIANEYFEELINKQKKEKHLYAKDTVPILITEKDFESLPSYVIWMYLYNPFTILNNLAMTTTAFSNFVLAACLLCAFRGQRLGATWFLALATYQSFYPVMLIVPVAMKIAEVEGSLQLTYKNASTWKSICGTVFLFILWCIGLLILSYEFMNSWNFLSSIHGFVLFAPDLSPNIGLFWYFFTEMFDHFQMFFICTFQINAFIYILPLAIRLKKNPMLLFFLLCCLMTIFKSYPSIGDVAFYMSFLPMFTYLSKYMRQTFLISGIFLACTVLLPITRYLWLYAGSANSNFYFSITLAFATGQIFLATDILFAYLKREFHLINGVKIEKEGKPAKIILN